MTFWPLAPKPAELAETRLLDSILDGTFPINSLLPPERALAEQLGVTRPTLREALQRLSRDGWIEIHHGKSTRVKDYLKEGNLLILNGLVFHSQHLPDNFIANLLKVRILLAPEYGRLAVINNPNQVIAALEPLLSLPDTPEAYAQADQSLHHQLTILSENPAFALITNGFAQLEVAMGLVYFQSSASRQHSRSFYSDLLTASRTNQPDDAARIIRKVMEDSVTIWYQQSGTVLEE